MRVPRQRRRGLSMTDVLVVLVVILLAVGLLLALLPRAHESSDRVKCAFHLKEIGDAVQRFQQRAGYLPAGRIDARYATWAVQIAPELSRGSGKALAGWDLTKDYYAQADAARQAQITFFYCPARRQPPQNSNPGDIPQDGKPKPIPFPGALGDYAGAAGDGTPEGTWDTAKANGAIILGDVLKRDGGLIIGWRGRVSLKAMGSHSRTVLIGEKHVPFGQFGQTAVGDGSLYNGDYPASASRVGGAGFGIARTINDPFNRQFGSYHEGGACQFLMADNHVETLMPSVEEAVLGRLMVRKPPEKKP